MRVLAFDAHVGEKEKRADPSDFGLQGFSRAAPFGFIFPRVL
jgi:hypothetical protein